MHLSGRGAGSHSDTMSPVTRPTSVQSGILIQPAVWPQQSLAEKWEGTAVPLSGEELSPHPTQCRLGRGLPPSSRLTTIDMGLKLGSTEECALFSLTHV